MTQRIAIIGAGLMGHGLALVFARGGHDVAITDAVPNAANSVRERVAASLEALGEDIACVDRIRPSATIGEAVAAADLVIEAVSEKLALKQEIFEEIERFAQPDAILASNTSVIPITQVMARVTRKHRALGTHWWNPPYLVPLVEVIQTADTSADSISVVMQLLIRLGKVPVHVKKDVPGFVGNRLQHALWREAIALVADGVCDAETVDLVVKNSFGRRLAVLGPLENADMVGTDLTLDIHEQVLAALDRGQGPNPYLRGLVQGGKLGFKSNLGFRSWTEKDKAKLRLAVMDHLKMLNNLFGHEGGKHGNEV